MLSYAFGNHWITSGFKINIIKTLILIFHYTTLHTPRGTGEIRLQNDRKTYLPCDRRLTGPTRIWTWKPADPPGWYKNPHFLPHLRKRFKCPMLWNYFKGVKEHTNLLKGILFANVSAFFRVHMPRNSAWAIMHAHSQQKPFSRFLYFTLIYFILFK